MAGVCSCHGLEWGVLVGFLRRPTFRRRSFGSSEKDKTQKLFKTDLLMSHSLSVLVDNR